MSISKNLGIKLPFIILVWVVMAMGIGSSIWLVRVLIIIQIEGIYIANEPNSLILSSEIIFFIVGILISIIIMIKISKILLEKMM
ncbi:MAG: hypothetical protein KGD74_03035 [Candidatus Lokiarchaeota archaeon]|nr:hypothetical protein [Candidatus Lokiarchaeota archaeon]